MSSIVIKKISEEEIEELQIAQWPIWEKEPSEFPWFYDERECCLILEGEALIEYSEGFVVITVGDYVTFSKGLRCVWKITSAIKKHYSFG